jgi:hypothetical protein
MKASNGMPETDTQIAIGQIVAFSLGGFAKTAGETNSLFLVTEDDFREMDRLVQDTRLLRKLIDELNYAMDKALRGIIFPNTRKHILRLRDDVTNHARGICSGGDTYLALCRKLKAFCVKIDDLTKWYIKEADVIIRILIDISENVSRFTKYENHMSEPQKAAINSFFDKWGDTVTNLEGTANRLEGEYRAFNNFFQNELKTRIDGLPSVIKKLNDAMSNQSILLMNLFTGNINQYYNSIMTGNAALYRLPAFPLHNLVIYLGHIGTFYNDIKVKILSAKNAFFKAENAAAILTFMSALEQSKQSWLLSEEASQAFIRAASKYIY